MKFNSTVASKAEGPFLTFSEAFTNFWTRFMALVNGGTSRQMLEWCWIEGIFDDESKTPLLWEDAKDFAYELGLLVREGDLQKPVPEVDPFRVELEFTRAKLGDVTQTAEQMATAVQKLTEIGV